MAELKYEGVNADVKALEEQNENIKKSNTVNQTTKKMSFDPKNYLDLKLGENENEKTLKIRLLPISATDSTIFFEIITHALKVDKEIAQSGFKSYVCLNDEKIKTEESCPICNKSKKLFEDADKAGELVCDKSGQTCDLYDQSFPLEEGLINNIIQAVVRELLGAMYRPKDNLNNANDDMATLEYFLSRNIKKGVRDLIEDNVGQQ